MMPRPRPSSPSHSLSLSLSLSQPRLSFVCCLRCVCRVMSHSSFNFPMVWMEWKKGRCVPWLLLMLLCLCSEGFELSSLSSHRISRVTLAPSPAIMNLRHFPLIEYKDRVEYRAKIRPAPHCHSSRVWLRPQPSCEENGKSTPEDQSVNIGANTVVVIAVCVGLILATSIPAQHISVANAIPAAPNLSAGDLFDPSQFQPVCGASDSLYFILKNLANAIVGKPSFFACLILCVLHIDCFFPVLSFYFVVIINNLRSSFERTR